CGRAGGSGSGRGGTGVLGSWLDRPGDGEDGALIHDPVGVERRLQGREDRVGAAVLLLRPRGPVLPDAMVVHHRATVTERFLDDDRVEWDVVLLDLLL